MATFVGPDGLPVTIPDDSVDSITLDFGGGYAAAPGAPGSIGPDGKIITGIQVGGGSAAVKSPSVALSSTTVILGAVGLVFLLSLVGGRR